MSMFRTLGNPYSRFHYPGRSLLDLEHPAECRRPAFRGSLWREMTLFYSIYSPKSLNMLGTFVPTWGHLSLVPLSPPGDKCPHVGTNVPKWGQLSPRGDKCPHVGTNVPKLGLQGYRVGLLVMPPAPHERYDSVLICTSLQEISGCFILQPNVSHRSSNHSFDRWFNRSFIRLIV